MKVYAIEAELIEAGDDDEGTPRLVFEVKREDIREWKLPLYEHVTLVMLEKEETP
jgi:hypothetical protein